MKLIKFAAAALISLSSLTAHAAYFQIVGGTSGVDVPANNDYEGSLPAGQTYNVGGNLQSNFDGVLSLDFTFLGEDADYINTFTSASVLTAVGGSIDNQLPSPFFGYFDDFNLGELLSFSFSTNGFAIGNTVVNGSNTAGVGTVSFATALETTFAGFGSFDAILFFDDTGGGPPDDDNHDDLIIGVRVLSATTTSTVPEPSTIVLMMMGMAGLFAARRLKA